MRTSNRTSARNSRRNGARTALHLSSPLLKEPLPSFQRLLGTWLEGRIR